MESDRSRTAVAVSVRTMVVNIFLSAFKLFAGIFAHSGAMLSDAVHSLSDVMSTVVVIIGVKLAGKGADHKHPYGHERIECVAAVLLAVLLGATGLGIGAAGIRILALGHSGSLQPPGLLALIAAASSIVIKEGMYWYTRQAAKRIDSSALMADAWHHRSDALSSVGSLFGIAGARIGFPFLDPVASLVICIFILRAALMIFVDAVNKMLDTACDDETQERIEHIIQAQQGVLHVDQLKTRLFGDRIYLEVEIRAQGTLSLTEAHAIAHRVHDAVEAQVNTIKHCTVHVNPDSDRAL